MLFHHHFSEPMKEPFYLAQLLDCFHLLTMHLLLLRPSLRLLCCLLILGSPAYATKPLIANSHFRQHQLSRFSATGHTKSIIFFITSFLWTVTNFFPVLELGLSCSLFWLINWKQQSDLHYYLPQWNCDGVSHV